MILSKIWHGPHIDNVDKILDGLREESAENDANRTLSGRTVELIGSLNLVNALSNALSQPSGSSQITLHDLLGAATRIAHGCASTSWVFGVYICGNYVRSLASDSSDAGDGERTALVLGRPATEVSPTRRGVSVSGRWPYASGVNHASASCVLLLDPRDGRPKLGLLDSTQYSVEDTWAMPGMRGTGSNTIVAKSAFLADSRLVDYQAALDARLQGGGYSLASLLMVGLLGSLIGTTEAAFEKVALESSNRRPPGAPFATSAETPPIIQRVGQESVALEQIRLLADKLANLGDEAARTQPLTWSQRAWARSSATEVAVGCRSVVDGLITAYGTSALDPESTLNRAWRDTHVGSRHAGFGMDIPTYARGIALLGGDPTTATFLL